MQRILMGGRREFFSIAPGTLRRIWNPLARNLQPADYGLAGLFLCALGALCCITRVALNFFTRQDV